MSVSDHVGECIWRLPHRVLRGPGFLGPVTEACDAARQKLALERIPVDGSIWDVRVVCCNSDEQLQACAVQIEGRSGESRLTAYLMIEAKAMADGDWLSACARHALRVVLAGEPQRTFDFT